MDRRDPFHDVFGGPPRRYSMTDSSSSRRRDSMDSYSYSSRERASGSGLGVFGDVNSPGNRRRHLKEDFFNDIFQSSDSACSSPRKSDQNLFPPLQPLRDEDGSPDVFSYPSFPNAYVPNTTTHAVPTQDQQKIDGHTLYRQSPLARQISPNLDKSLETIDSANYSTQGHSQNVPTSLHSYISSGQFHFSIYKWAGKGVTLSMPSNSYSQNKSESRFRRLPEVVLQEVDLTVQRDNIPTGAKISKNQSGSQDNRLPNDVIVDRKDNANPAILKVPLPTDFESKILHSDAVKFSDIGHDTSEDNLVTTNVAQQHDLKNLRELFDDNLGEQRNYCIIREVKETERPSEGQQSVYDDINIKLQPGRESKRNPVKISPSKRDAPPVEEKMLGSRVKGKVKDFIKIFNQEMSTKRKGTFESPDRRSRGKDRGKSKIKDPVAASVAKSDEQTKTAGRNSNSASSDTHISMNQNFEKTESTNSSMIYDVDMNDESFSEMNDPVKVVCESPPDIFDDSVCNIEELHCEDLEGFVVEKLSEDGSRHLQTDPLQNQINIIDAKIREWSKGKEVNIRSLLSTLQYVLWPESGWKPVRLVDIIEGTSVKRAYQKALLYIHPDKLQQKGAATDQKYTAEKVFGILQEAWDHFNTMNQF